MAKRGEGPLDVDPGRPARQPDSDEPGKGDELDEQQPELGEEPVVGLVDAEALERNARGVLKAQGAIANAFTRAAGKGPEDAWLWTEAELDVICPAIASYAARHARLASTLENADLLVIGTTGATYALREAGRVRAYTAAQAEDLSDVDTGTREPPVVVERP